MTRNKELYLPIALSMALTFVSGLLCGFLGGPWAALTGSGSVLLTTLLWMSTTWSRYKKLQELGEYLASVYAGGELLDIYNLDFLWSLHKRTGLQTLGT